jgi:shikimate dehydrogenase
MDFEPAVDALWQLGATGFAVSMPYKMTAAAMAKQRSEATDAIGAANLLVRDESLGGWSAHNTDWIGAMRALDDNTAGVELAHAVVVGAGGAARALAYGLSIRGVRVDVMARRHDAAQQLVDDLQLNGHAYALLERDHIESADLVVNATADSSRDGAVHLAQFPNARVLFEVAAVPMVTGTAEAALERNMIVVPGWQMMLHQAYEQWNIVTGADAPVDAMRDAAIAKLQTL